MIFESIGQHFKNIGSRSWVQRAALKLQWVSREEFDIQVQVLQKTREKLRALEERLEKLEAKKIHGIEIDPRRN